MVYKRLLHALAIKYSPRSTSEHLRILDVIRFYYLEMCWYIFIIGSMNGHHNESFAKKTLIFCYKSLFYMLPKYKFMLECIKSEDYTYL